MPAGLAILLGTVCVHSIFRSTVQVFAMTQNMCDLSTMQVECGVRMARFRLQQRGDVWTRHNLVRVISTSDSDGEEVPLTVGTSCFASIAGVYLVFPFPLQTVTKAIFHW